MKTSKEMLADPALGLVREARAPQQAMAASIEETLAAGGLYIVEAPVGCGKSFAYLLPALLAKGRRVVVATAKKQLQDQIVTKDLPAIKHALGADVAQALGGQMLATALKGKGNYACVVQADVQLKQDPLSGGVYRRFLKQSPYGDRADYPGQVPRWWGAATAEDCAGKKCERFDDCGYIRLKRDATQSKIVVVNHHVLGAEMFFGHGKLVGGPYDILIVDEAHTLAAGIRAAFTYKVSEDAIQALSDTLRRTSHTFPEVRQLVAPWEAMFAAVEGRTTDAATRAVPVFDPALAAPALDGLRKLSVALSKLEELYKGDEAREREPADEGYDGEPAEIFGERVMPVDTIELDADVAAQDVKAASGRELALIGQAVRRVDGLLRGLMASQGQIAAEALTGTPDEQARRRDAILANTVVYAGQDERGRFSVNCAPVNVGGIAKTYLASVKSTVLCSATLAINETFDHMLQVTGTVPYKTEILPTAFKYDAQGFVYIPRDLPVVPRTDPMFEAVMQRRIERILHLTTLSNGGAFILTTANTELDAYTEALRARFPGRVFAQGHRKNPWDGDAPAALAKFRATENAILVGSKSFWEGVDVPGGALRLVILAKLPFPVLGEPIIQARSRLAGPTAFNDVQVADMLIDLRQGVGRLIRSRDDRGGVAILDSRVWTTAYGSQVRRALPWSNNYVTSADAVPAALLPKYAAHFQGKSPA